MKAGKLFRKWESEVGGIYCPFTAIKSYSVELYLGPFQLKKKKKNTNYQSMSAYRCQAVCISISSNHHSNHRSSTNLFHRSGLTSRGQSISK